MRPVFNNLIWTEDCDYRGVESQLKVLVVEDDNAMAQMCAKLIRRQGHAAVIAGSCRDALALVRSAGDIDAVLTDIQMPGMSGIDLLTQLRRFDAHLPVILMTGYATVVASDQALTLGATDYLAKPFDAETLVFSLERALSSRPGDSETG